jgi:hypothetical protein
MAENADTKTAESAAQSLPRRDWILLPLLSLLTVLALAGGTELAARKIFSDSKTGMERCMVLNDPATGARGIPNSVCWEKSPENPNIEFRFNRCGHRAGIECGPKPSGTYRIVMMGSSVAMGERVQQQESFAALLPKELEQRTGRRIELYNESMGWGFSHSLTLRFDQALNAQPDLILWILTPMDVERSALVLPTEGDLFDGGSLTLTQKLWQRARAAFAGKSFTAAMGEVFGRTRTALLLRHYLYKSQSQYLQAALAAPDEDIGFLKSSPSPEWQAHLHQFSQDAAEIEARANAAGIPLVAVLLPEREQAAMISVGAWPSGYDPYRLDEELRAIMAANGATYVDILPQFRAIANPEQYYYPVDGHPDPRGHRLLSGLLAGALSDGSIPALRAKPASESTSSPAP